MDTSFLSISLHNYSGAATTCLTLMCLGIPLCDAQRNPQPVVSDSTDGLCQEKEQNNKQRWNYRGKEDGEAVVGGDGAVLWSRKRQKKTLTFKKIYDI